MTHPKKLSQIVQSGKTIPNGHHPEKLLGIVFLDGVHSEEFFRILQFGIVFSDGVHSGLNHLVSCPFGIVFFGVVFRILFQAVLFVFADLRKNEGFQLAEALFLLDS